MLCIPVADIVHQQSCLGVLVKLIANFQVLCWSSQVPEINAYLQRHMEQSCYLLGSESSHPLLVLSRQGAIQNQRSTSSFVHQLWSFVCLLAELAMPLPGTHSSTVELNVVSGTAHSRFKPGLRGLQLNQLNLLPVFA